MLEDKKYIDEIKKYLNYEYLDNVIVHLKYGFEGDLNILFEKYLELIKKDFLNDFPEFNNKKKQNKIFKEFKGEIVKYVKDNIVEINNRNRLKNEKYHV